MLVSSSHQMNYISLKNQYRYIDFLQPQHKILQHGGSMNHYGKGNHGLMCQDFPMSTARWLSKLHILSLSVYCWLQQWAYYLILWFCRFVHDMQLTNREFSLYWCLHPQAMLCIMSENTTMFIISRSDVMLFYLHHRILGLSLSLSS